MTPSKQRLLVIGLVVVGLVAVSFFGLRAVHAFRKFGGQRPPPFPSTGAESAETDVELIRDWMTIPFIARTYHVPMPTLFEALDIPIEGNREKSLKELNEKYFAQAPDIVLELIKAAVRANQLPPTAPPPSTALPPLTPHPPVIPLPAVP